MAGLLLTAVQDELVCALFSFFFLKWDGLQKYCAESFG